VIPGKLVPAIAAGLTLAVGGCQELGPQSINLGRGRYNDIIHTTSTDQTMANIVRVYDHDLPQFMDVTEVDSTISATVSANGASSNIGAKHGAGSGMTVAGQVGLAGGMIGYAETPTIRYQPLLGQPLVAQLVTPVSADALGYLYDSTWDPAPLLDFSAAYLTTDTHEFYPALDTIKELHDLEAVELAAAATTAPVGGSDQASAGGSDQTSAGGAKGGAHGAGNDALVFYLLAFHKDADASDRQRVLQLWVRMLRLYASVQNAFTPQSPALCQQIGLSRLDERTLKDWDVNIAKHVVGTDAEKMRTLLEARSCLPRYIALRIVPSPLYALAKPASFDGDAGGYADPAHAKKTDQNTDFDDHILGDDASTTIPLMRTYSALGILKNATERPGPRIEFVSPDVYRAIRAQAWNGDTGDRNYYIMTPDVLDSVDCPAAQKQSGCDNPIPPGLREKIDPALRTWLQNGSGAAAENPDAANPYPGGLTVFEEPGSDVLDPEHLNMNGRLGTLRRYMLIVVSDDAPSDPTYVSYYADDRWYSIMKDDAVSQKNFQLLSLFMTMMAVPPSTQPLSPVINVGGP
jgi:hypothetical protein